MEERRCPAAGCPRRIIGTHPVCSRCWFSLSKSVRLRVTRDLAGTARERQNARAELYAELEGRAPRRGPRAFVRVTQFPAPRVHRDGCAHDVTPGDREALARGEDATCVNCGATILAAKEAAA